MPNAKYQFEDFLETINDDCKSLVVAVHKMLLEDGYKAKIQITKSTGLQLSYHQPKIKTTAGIILTFFLHGDELVIRIYGKHHKAYPKALDSLPESIAKQIDKADDCIKFIDPQKCWKGCGGYSFYIRGKLYQKCITNCFQISFNAENMPYLLEIIKCESKERLAE
ncbi:MAG: hypothetical protein FWC69_03640 [Defluviitaleaceae bacterium]|nr:hypothetical protein [Defluviitaleaceae bacterium]